MHERLGDRVTGYNKYFFRFVLSRGVNGKLPDNPNQQCIHYSTGHDCQIQTCVLLCMHQETSVWVVRMFVILQIFAF
jgi:hypothetical protein